MAGRQRGSTRRASIIDRSASENASEALADFARASLEGTFGGGVEDVCPGSTEPAIGQVEGQRLPQWR